MFSNLSDTLRQVVGSPVSMDDFNTVHQAQGQTKSRKRAKQLRPEDEYADLIKAGLVRVIRQRGKPPRIIFTS